MHIADYIQSFSTGMTTCIEDSHMATAAFKIYDVGIQTGVILNRAKMAVEHIADLGRYRLGSRDGIV